MDNKESQASANNCQSMSWWATLIVAVLAVPSFGIIASAIFGAGDFGEIAVFIVACWFCTYLGMRLMKNPKMSEPFDLGKK